MKCTSPRVIVRTDIQVPNFVYKYKYDIEFMKNNPDYFMLVPCGHCRACRKAKAREWTTRLLYESSFWSKSCFLTLQYNPEHVPVIGDRPDDVPINEFYGTLYQTGYNFGTTLVRDEVPKFINRLRESYFRKFHERLKCAYYYVGEYGDCYGRPHYHLIFFGLDSTDQDLIEKCWKFGHVTIGSVKIESIQYVVGYVQKKLNGSLGREVYGYRVAPFGQGSPGLGLRYFNDHKKKFYQDKCAHLNGHKVSVPRYFFKKDEEFHEQVMMEQDSPPLLRLIDCPETFWKDVGQRTAESVRRVQTHTRYSVN